MRKGLLRGLAEAEGGGAALDSDMVELWELRGQVEEQECQLQVGLGGAGVVTLTVILQMGLSGCRWGKSSLCLYTTL